MNPIAPGPILRTRGENGLRPLVDVRHVSRPVLHPNVPLRVEISRLPVEMWVNIFRRLPDRLFLAVAGSCKALASGCRAEAKEREVLHFASLLHLNRLTYRQQLGRLLALEPFPQAERHRATVLDLSDAHLARTLVVIAAHCPVVHRPLVMNAALRDEKPVIKEEVLSRAFESPISAAKVMIDSFGWDAESAAIVCGVGSAPAFVVSTAAMNILQDAVVDGPARRDFAAGHPLDDVALVYRLGDREVDRLRDA